MVGTTVSHYRVAEKIGEGGMGVVYKALDVKLGRTVALKFVRPELIESAHHKERFVREAQAIAALEHPNICTIHEIDEADGQTFFAMAFVDGESVKDKISGRPLKLEDALDIAIQTAEGLDAAHAKGVVHRDIKPANLITNAGGQVKIMDFGLARLADRPSVTRSATILGTPAYMSPEQAQGSSGDSRSDLWSLGAVLYEMLTGRPPFAVEHGAAVLHAILHEEHEPITAVRAGLPIELDRILEKALAKRPEERYQHARDLLIDLRQLRARLESGVPRLRGRREGAATLRSMVRERAAWAMLVAALVAACIWLAARSARELPPTIARVFVNVSPAERLRALAGDDGFPRGRPSRTAVAISPDGRCLVFSGMRGRQQLLYVRWLESFEANPLAATEGASGPSFSPDGQWILFWAPDALKKVAVSGGPPVVVAEATGPVVGASWGANDTIVFATERGGLWRVSARGGKPEALTEVDIGRREYGHRFPHLLPDGRTVIFTVTQDGIPNWDRTEIVAQRLDTGSRTRLIQGGADARYVEPGYLVYMRQGVLMAAAFDATNLQLTGGPVGMVAGVMQASNMGFSTFDSGAGQFAVSRTGTLAYAAGAPMTDPEFSLVWVARNGQKVTPLATPVGYYLGPRLSSDGRRIAVATFSGDTAKRNVWIHDIASRAFLPLTTTGDVGMPVWTPDSERLVFPSGGAFSGTLSWTRADGTGKLERLAKGEFGQHPSSISRRGNVLAYVERGDIWSLVLDGQSAPKPFTNSPAFEGFPDFSPNGRYIAYTSTETGGPEVFIQPFPGPGAKQLVSNGGGQAPVWRSDGGELFYQSPHFGPPPEDEPVGIMAVPVTAKGSDLAIGSPVKLFEGRYFPSAPVRSYDVTADGQQFVMVQMDQRPLDAVREILLVQNWLHEVMQRVPRRN